MTDPSLAALELASIFPAATDAMWVEAAIKALKGGDFDKKLVSRSMDGFTILPLYPRKAGAELVTGATAGSRWRISQRMDHPDDETAARQALGDLEGGAGSLDLVFAGAGCARGYGINPADVAALDGLLQGVMLDLITLRIDSAPFEGRRSASLLTELGARRKITPTALTIDLGLDPIGDMALKGGSPLAFTEMAANMADIARSMMQAGFKGHFVRADARCVHEAGGSEGQELAFLLAAIVAYLRVLEAADFALDEAMGILSFTIAVDADQFMGMAKLRALRKLMARVQQACGLEPTPIFLHAETSWRMLTRRDAPVNMLRNTIAVFAAGIGGADSITVLPHSLAQGLPNEFARRVARNCQHILLEEANLFRVADPAAGSGGIEGLTNELCETAWKQFQEIERAGGLPAALASGMVQAKIAATKTARDKMIAMRRMSITGTSEYPDLHEKAADILEFAPQSPSRRRENLLAIESLPSARLAEPYEALRARADIILAATKQRPRIFMANLGPVSAFTARMTFARGLFEAGGIEAVANDGFWEEQIVIPDGAQREAGIHDRRDGRQMDPRSGLQPVGADNGGTNLIALTNAFKVSGASLACLCSSDDVYAAEATAAAMALTASGARGIYIAGRLPDMEAALAAAGVTGAIYVGCDVLKILEGALDVANS